jgi:antirestriction protein ArdC
MQASSNVSVRRSPVNSTEALTRAISGQSVANYAQIYREFMARGIAESEIKPRENVFTYNAWRALGRQVRRGEHGVKVLTFIDCEKKDAETGEVKETYRRPWTTTVFHISQTDAIPGGAR